MDKKLRVETLNIEHLADVMQLQDKIIANLQPDEKHFILKRSAADFMKALDSENTHMIGVFDGNKLVAQSIFEFPQNGSERDYEEFVSDIANNDLVVYKATIVDVDYRGMGLMQELLSYREQKARAAGKTTAISQIAMDNPASWINAIKNGMSIRKVDYDPEDHAKVLYMQKDFFAGEPIPSAENSFAMYIGQNIHKEIPALFNKMRYLAGKGYHGIKLDRQTNSIIWSRPQKEKELVLEGINLSRQFYLEGVRDKTTRN